MACYVAVGLFFAISQLRWYVVAAFCLASIYLMVAPFPAVPELLAQFFFVAPCFAFGSLLFFWHERGKLPRWPLIVCAAIAAAAVWSGKTVPLFPAYGAYPLILLATAQKFRLPGLKRFGDISYGMYLYGWPMEQVARAIIGPGAAWWQIFPLGLAGAAALGFLSWHLLEEHALRLKKWRVVFVRE
jgi:peptidoglycan/LPS O-acetylase OafA/YrhL